MSADRLLILFLGDYMYLPPDPYLSLLGICRGNLVPIFRAIPFEILGGGGVLETKNKNVWGDRPRKNKIKYMGGVREEK